MSEPVSTTSGGGGSSSHAPGSAGRGRFGNQGRWFTSAAVLLVASTLVMVRQEPPTDAYGAETVTPRDAEWWLRPVEFNRQRRLPLVFGDLNDVFVLPGKGGTRQQVWVVGNGGLILHSGDLGRNWKRIELVKAAARKSSPARSAAAGTGVGPVDAAGLLAVAGAPPQGNAGRQGDSGDPPPPPPAPPLPTRQQAGGAAAAGGRGAAATSPGQAAGTGTNRRSRTAEELARSDLRSVWFADEKTGWVAGDFGALFVTHDGGGTWALLPGTGIPPEEQLSELIFEGSRGWLTAGVWLRDFPGGPGRWERGGGFSWSRYQTEDGGNSWIRPDKVDQHVSLVGTAVQIEQGARVSFQYLDHPASVSNHPQDRAAVDYPIVLRHEGLRSLARGRFAPGQEIPTLKAIFALDESSPSVVWAVGARGVAFRSVDNGLTWNAQDFHTQQRLTAIHFLDDGHGWMTGAAGTLVATENGGATWFRQSRNTVLGTAAAGNQELAARAAAALGPYSMWPAPWYFLSLLVVVALLVPTLAPLPPDVGPEKSLVDSLLTDRAIDREEADALKFNPVVLGLSAFLRNVNTEPPLTIAITGEWGSGKSSLMNLLRADLRRRRWHPVWFNAWHHQKEQHLLASLLEAVRAQAVPPWWRPEGARFRPRLLRIRAERFWPVVLLLLVAFLFSAGYVAANPERTKQAAVRLQEAASQLGNSADRKAKAAERTAVQGVVQVPVGAAAPADLKGQRSYNSKLTASQQPEAIGRPREKSEGGSEQLPLVAFLVTASGVIAAAARGVKGFGVNPAKLLARRSTKVRDLEALTGFRHRFAAEFRDVTAALNPQTMLILIDDLDRCRPEMVLEVLEAVNFLVTSGDCFVVLGMARDWVLRSVGWSFQEVAGELLDRPADLPADLTQEDIARTRRQEFARQYLEKLINLEVAVPVATDKQLQDLVAPPRTKEEVEEERRRSSGWRRKRLLRATRRALPAAALLVVLISGFVYGLRQGPAPASSPAQPPISGGVSEIRPAPPPAPPAPTPPGFAVWIGGQPGPPAPPPVLAGPMHSRPLPFVVLGLTLAGFGVWRLSVPRDLVTHDSPKFAEALKLWQPVITSSRHTPRAIKRYVNRVRCLEMLQRPAEKVPGPWKRIVEEGKRIVDAVLRRQHEAQRLDQAPAAIPEQVLVALSAIELRHPAWITGDRPLAECAREPGADPHLVKLIGGGQDLEVFRHDYRELAKGIRTSTEGAGDTLSGVERAAT
jgi:photosystem II stability/assembly factor-like uncharacterized protein